MTPTARYLSAAGITFGVILLGTGAHVVINERATLEQRARSADLLKEAVNDPKRRQEYLNTYSKPEHVKSIEYVDETVQQMFNERGLQIPKHSHIMVMPVDEDNKQVHLGQWQGKKSKVYVFESQFPDYSALPIESKITKSEFYEGQDYILRTRVERNAGFQARMMSEGIEGFPLDSFKDKNSRFNNQFYSATIILLSDLNEFGFHMNQRAMIGNPLVESYLISLENSIAENYFHLTNSLDRIWMDSKAKKDFMARIDPRNALRGNK